MDYIPSGCVPMRSAIDGTIKSLFGIDPAAGEANWAEYFRLFPWRKNQPFQRGVVFASAQVEEDDIAYQTLIARMQSLDAEWKQLEEANGQAITSLLQALAYGALKAAAVTDDGHIIEVPIPAWRAQGGRDAIIRERIS